MTSMQILIRDWCIRIAPGLCCPFCKHPLTRHAIECRDPANEWGLICQHCHHTVLDMTALDE
jgi:hypothetical protein